VVFNIYLRWDSEISQGRGSYPHNSGVHDMFLPVSVTISVKKRENSLLKNQRFQRPKYQRIFNEVSILVLETLKIVIFKCKSNSHIQIDLKTRIIKNPKGVVSGNVSGRVGTKIKGIRFSPEFMRAFPLD